MEQVKNTKSISAIIALASLTVSYFIVMHYWRATELHDIKFIPTFVLILCLVYVGIQMLKRNVIKKQNWWDWIYFIGLIAIAITKFFVNSTNFELMLKIAQYGVLFLIIPILIEGYFITKPKES